MEALESREGERVTEVKSTVIELSQPSTSATAFQYVTSGADIVLQLDYEDEDGRKAQDTVTFRRVRASRWRSESCCTPWHINGVFDTVAIVRESGWLAELSAVVPEHQRPTWSETEHFMLYVDGVGCHEFLADSVDVVST